MKVRSHGLNVLAGGGILLGAISISGCKSPTEHRLAADEKAEAIIAEKQREALGETRPFTIEQPEQMLRKRLMLEQNLLYADPASLGTYDLPRIPAWPDDPYLDEPRVEADPVVQVPEGAQPLRLTLFEALQVAARNSRAYQSQKENVFLAALDLDLERYAFDWTFAGVLQGEGIADLGDPDVAGVAGTASGSVSKVFRNGAALTSRIGVDLVRLLTQGEDSSLGLFADASIAIPLLRGSGRDIVGEPLLQAERDALYSIWSFERFKRTFAVDIATAYLNVLQLEDQVANAESNYRRLITSTRNVQQLARAGRQRGIDVDQAMQNQLRARERWISSRQRLQGALDNFKITLGLPTDAWVVLDREELDRLASVVQDAINIQVEEMAPEAEVEAIPNALADVTLVEPSREGAGPYEFDEVFALAVALEHRLDLQIAIGEVFDAQRLVAVAADRLRAELTLLGSASVGSGRGSLSSATLPDATDLALSRGDYNALLTLDLPLDRRVERNNYRARLITLERAIREMQSQEDQVKLQIRNDLRRLLEAREGVGIQAQAVQVAERRVASTELFLQAGRAEIRDVLEAQEALVDAQNALTSALVSYRVAELEIQRDMGVLDVNEQGLWQEFNPSEVTDGNP